jgi:hypothetical protein
MSGEAALPRLGPVFVGYTVSPLGLGCPPKTTPDPVVAPVAACFGGAMSGEAALQRLGPVFVLLKRPGQLAGEPASLLHRWELYTQAVKGPECGGVGDSQLASLATMNERDMGSAS